MAKPLTPLEQKQLSAFVEIIPNRSVHLVQEALDSGYYRGVSLYDAQRTLLSHENFSEFGEEFATHGSYNREVFEKFLNRVATDPRGLFDRIKRAVWNNDLDILDPNKTPQSTEKVAAGELVPPHPVADQPPPASAKSSDHTEVPPQDEETKKTPETPEQETEEPVAESERRLPEETQQRLNQANRSMQRTQRARTQARQAGQQSSQLAERMNQRLDTANQAMQRTTPETRAPSGRVRAGRSVRISRDSRQNRRKIPPIRQASTPSSGGLLDSLNNYLLARDALSFGKWLADKLGFTRLGNLLGRLNNFLGLPGQWLGQGLRALANIGGQIGRQLLSGLAQGGANLLSRLALQTGLNVARVLLVGVLTNPFFWIVVALTALFIFAWWYDSSLGNSQCDKPGQMQVKKILGNPSSGADQVRNGQRIDFVIETTYTWLCRTTNVESITVTDKVPEGVIYDNENPTAESEIAGLGEGPKGTYNASTRTLTWTVTNIPSNTPVNYYFSVMPTEAVNDSWVPNSASVSYKVAIAGSTVSSGGDYPPTQDNCGGKYPLNNPIGNFGDPVCDFDKDKLYAMLQQLDPVNAAYWFNVVVPQESTYSPNAFNGSSTSGRGAYGLFQMNPNREKTDTYDQGDVNWQRQVSNAINYNNMLAQNGRAWCYWAAAADRWTPRCRQQ